jgi:hypothetical protein
MIKRLLKPGGALYLFYEPPDPAGAGELAGRLHAALSAQGFVTATLTAATPRSLLLGVVATPLGGGGALTGSRSARRD